MNHPRQEPIAQKCQLKFRFIELSQLKFSSKARNQTKFTSKGSCRSPEKNRKGLDCVGGLRSVGVAECGGGGVWGLQNERDLK